MAMNERTLTKQICVGIQVGKRTEDVLKKGEIKTAFNRRRAEMKVLKYVLEVKCVCHDRRKL